MAALWRSYLALLDRRPLPTKCITSGLIMLAGDAIQQAFEHRGRLIDHESATAAAAIAHAAADAAAAASAANCTENGECALPPRRPRPVAVGPAPTYLGSYDVARSVRSGVFGALAVGPIFHVWFRSLDRIFPGSTFRPVAKKMLLDQGFMAPVFTVFYFGVMGVMERRPVEEIKHKIAVATGPTLLANYCIFPASQFLNFMFVPPQLRVLVLNAGGLVYNVYLSKYNAAAESLGKEKEKQAVQEQQQEEKHTSPIATAAQTAAAASKKQIKQ